MNPLDRLEQIANTRAEVSLSVGQEITLVSEEPWREADGTRHMHTFRYRAVITKIHPDGGFSCDTTEILSEEDAPTNIPSHGAPIGCSMSGFGVNASLANGRLIL